MKAINVIIGPPCAGKSSHVANNRNVDDVVVDYDLIAEAIGNTVPHNASGSIRTLAFALRMTAISKIMSGIENDAWIISTSPSSDLLRKLDDAGAVIKILDPGMDECLDRAEKDDRPEGTEGVIREWYENPPELRESNRELILERIERTLQMPGL